MQKAELEAEFDKISGTPKPTRRLRKDQDKDEEIAASGGAADSVERSQGDAEENTGKLLPRTCSSDKFQPAKLFDLCQSAAIAAPAFLP